EDPLRIIRALRFSSQLGFSIEVKTLESMQELAPEINTLAVERITKEMTKFFSGPAVNRGFDYLLETKVYYFLPIFNIMPEIVQQIPRPLASLPSFGAVIALFHYLNREVSIARWIKAWKGSNQMR